MSGRLGITYRVQVCLIHVCTKWRAEDWKQMGAVILVIHMSSKSIGIQLKTSNRRQLWVRLRGESNEEVARSCPLPPDIPRLCRSLVAPYTQQASLRASVFVFTYLYKED